MPIVRFYWGGSIGQSSSAFRGALSVTSIQPSLGLSRCRALPAGVVDGVLPGEDDLRDGDKGVALLEKSLDDGGQGLGGVKGGVVKQDDGPRLHLGGHPPGDLPGLQVLPVQAVTECNKGKVDRLEKFSKWSSYLSNKRPQRNKKIHPAE